MKGHGLEADDATALIAQIYGDLASDVSSCSHQMLMDKGILCPRNEDVFFINDIDMGLFGQGLPQPLQERVFLSVDTHMERPDQMVLPSEFFNTIDSSELPPHELKLKQECPLMCLRNINPKVGLMNGTHALTCPLALSAAGVCYKSEHAPALGVQPSSGEHAACQLLLCVLASRRTTPNRHVPNADSGTGVLSRKTLSGTCLLTLFTHKPHVVWPVIRRFVL
eukprot:365360-Chlamydomonas_euryale.AAC.4